MLFRSVLLNDAALGILINITYACSVNDEKFFSSPPESGIFGQWLSPDETCLVLGYVVEKKF